MEYPRRWENISENTYRLKVPGGWLVKDVYTFVSGEKACSVSHQMLFIADLNERWILEDR